MFTEKDIKAYLSKTKAVKFKLTPEKALRLIKLGDYYNMSIKDSIRFHRAAASLHNRLPKVTVHTYNKRLQQFRNYRKRLLSFDISLVDADLSMLHLAKCASQKRDEVLGLGVDFNKELTPELRELLYSIESILESKIEALENHKVEHPLRLLREAKEKFTFLTGYEATTRNAVLYFLVLRDGNGAIYLEKGEEHQWHKLLSQLHELYEVEAPKAAFLPYKTLNDPDLLAEHKEQQEYFK